MALTRKIAASAIGTITAFGGLAAASTAAYADYGGGATQDQWQVGLSFNCDNPNVFWCQDPNTHQPQLGGYWGWAVFDAAPGATTGTGDAQLSGCGHTQSAGGPGGAGAGEVALDGMTWTEAPAGSDDPAGPSGNVFVVTSYTITLKSHGRQQQFTTSLADPYTNTSDAGLADYVNGFLGDSGIPVDAGHYSFRPAPGVSGVIQVAFRPGS